ncbi:hypothetical protein SDJN03_15821, partial [Cucurbita argyrosperma subsp. sororia]
MGTDSMLSETNSNLDEQSIYKTVSKSRSKPRTLPANLVSQSRRQRWDFGDSIRGNPMTTLLTTQCLTGRENLMTN